MRLPDNQVSHPGDLGLFLLMEVEIKVVLSLRFSEMRSMLALLARVSKIPCQGC